jgi:cytochrome c
VRNRFKALLAVVALGSLVPTAVCLHAQEPDTARSAFGACAVCHSIDGSVGIGPTLKGVVGRKSGMVPGFRYSRAMRTAGVTWDAATLDRYLADPQSVVPGNVMPFSGVPDSDERARIIAYLISLR